MERPAGRVVIGLGRRLGDVMQHGGPAQPQVIAAACNIVEHLERVFEIVLVGMAVAALDALQPAQFGEYQFEQARSVQQFETDGRAWRHDNLVQLDGNTLLRDDTYALAVAPYGFECLLLDVEAELRCEPHAAHHAQRVVGKGDVGIARRTYDAVLEVVHALERVDQLAV